jgi:LacI family transcriptional regulator
VLLNPELGAAGDLESEEGFREGVAQQNREDVEASVVRHRGTVGDVCGAMATLFERRSPPTALLVSRAVNVLTVMGYLMRRGLRLPEDVSVISRDHEPFLAGMLPSVARYVVSPESMAHRISAAVLEMVQTGLVSAANYLIMPQFTPGDTLGPGPTPSHTPQK